MLIGASREWTGYQPVANRWSVYICLHRFTYDSFVYVTSVYICFTSVYICLHRFTYIIPTSVYIWLRLCVLLKRRSEQVSSMPWRVRGTAGRQFMCIYIYIYNVLYIYIYVYIYIVLYIYIYIYIVLYVYIYIYNVSWAKRSGSSRPPEGPPKTMNHKTQSCKCL